MKFDSKSGAYSYLKFSETGGSDKPYTRVAAFGKGTKESFEILDIQHIKPVFDGEKGENAKHLELSNPFAIVHLDPNNKVLKSEEVWEEEGSEHATYGQIITTTLTPFDGDSEISISEEDRPENFFT